MIKKLEKHFHKIIFALWISALLELVTNYKYLVFLRREFALLILAGVFVMILFLITDIGIKKPTLEMQIRGGILILPLFYMVIAYGSSLDSYAFQKRNVESAGIPMELLESPFSSDEQTSSQLPQAEDGTIPTTPLKLLQTPQLYQNKIITMVGMVFQHPSQSENQFVLFRFIVTCCAADAMPVAVAIESSSALEIENNKWVQVTGQFIIEQKDNIAKPVIKNAKVVAVAAPKIPYLF
jgi:uncharacterized repeat protein (TIGR03943 family)